MSEPDTRYAIVDKHGKVWTDYESESKAESELSDFDQEAPELAPHRVEEVTRHGE